MPPRPNPVPAYLRHAQSGRARVAWTDPATRARRSLLLPGPFGSDESRDAYRRFLATHAAAPPAGPPLAPCVHAPTMAEVLLAFARHAADYYRDADGRPTSQVREYQLVVRALRDVLPADAPAAAFGVADLRAAWAAWVAADLARTEVNRRVGLARRIFRWAAAEDLVPFDTYHRLTALTGLAKGRGQARETDPVRPVDPAHVDATLPHLNRVVRGLIEFVRLTGCRPGEACRLRMADVDTTGPVLLYRPAHHKMAHRGKDRVVAIGPRAQGLLGGFPTANPADYVFDPRAAVNPGAGRRCVRPGVRYSPGSVSQAVRRAVRRVNRLGRKRADWVPIPDWHPNQLRHAHATAVRRGFGLDAAQAVLGHARADVTQLYAERHTALAAEVAARLG